MHRQYTALRAADCVRTVPLPVVKKCTLGGTLGKAAGRKMSKKNSPASYGVPAGPLMHARSRLNLPTQGKAT